MIYNGDPKAIEAYRKTTASSPGYSTERVCKKCKRKRPIEKMKKGRINTRHSPTEWQCRDCGE